MKRPLITQHRAQTLLVILLIAASFLPAQWAAAISDRPRDLLAVILTPIRNPLRKFGDGMRRPPDVRLGLGESADIEANYAELLAYTRQLQEELRLSRQAIADLTELRRAVGAVSVQFVPADVASGEFGAGVRTLTINRGEAHGLREGFVVAAGANLVGRLGAVGLRTSTVRMISSPGTSLIVRVMPPTVSADPRAKMLQVRVSDDGQTFEARGDVGDVVQVGDVAHMADHTWPRESLGLIVGQVSEVRPDPDTPLLRTRVIIQPLRPLAHLGQVTVVRPVEAHEMNDGPTGN